MTTYSNGNASVVSASEVREMMDALPKSDPTGATGNVFSDPHLCDCPRFVRWNRTHRRPRVNKKWRKRYGATYERCRGVVVRVGGNLHACPCAVDEMKKESR